MEQRNLGRSGLRLSVVGLGTNNFGVRMSAQTVDAVVNAALDAGITFFDTADMYGNRGGGEELLGRALGSRRRDVVLATKFGVQMDDAGLMKGASRRYIMSAVEASLRRLNTDWIDLYQIHRPDPLTPIEETLRALDDLIRQGKVRHVGHSTFNGEQILEADLVARELGLDRCISCQSEYSLLNRAVEHEVIPACTASGVGFLPYYPLASGMLTGRYSQDKLPAADSRLNTPGQAKKYLGERGWRIVGELEQFCQRQGRTMLELAVNWLLAKPAVCCVMAGASTPEQVTQNAAVAGWLLTPRDMHELDRITSE